MPAIYIISIILRIVFGFVSKGNETDMNCFGAWSLRVFDFGFSEFYTPEVFTDYPPGYMYLLYPIGALQRLFKISYNTGIWRLIVKLPAIICDIITGSIIYRTAKEKFGDKEAATINISGAPSLKLTKAALISSLYLLNPVVIINSAVWGQVDSVLTVFVILTILNLTKSDRYGYTKACICYVLGVLIKPQMLIFSPLLIIGFAENIIAEKSVADSDNTVRSFFKALLYTLPAPILGLILALPFGLSNVFSQYFETVGSYSYATVNAYNIYALFGFNWFSADLTFMTLPFGLWGFIAIFAITISSFFLYILLRASGIAEARYFFTAAFIIFSVFMFSAKMHERYVFPFFALMLFAYIYADSLDIIGITIALSFVNFLNVYHILVYYDPKTYDTDTAFIRFAALLGLFTYSMFIKLLYDLIRGKSKSSAPDLLEAVEGLKNTVRITRPDICIMAGITIFYTFFAFYDLGSRTPFSAPDPETHRIEGGTSYDSMYFDEIYYARTAYEIMNGLPIYETTHPPLGKLIITEGVRIFGMNPFGWRFMGTLFGVFMLPVMYIFAKKLTEDTAAAALAAFIFAFDFMHFVQSRLCTIDVYITFFIMVMFLFMYLYIKRMAVNSFPHTLMPLGLCGIAFGLGISAKWTGAYAGMGLFIVFIAAQIISVYLFLRAHNLNNPDKDTILIKSSDFRRLLKEKGITIIFCIVFFIIIPLIIYISSYIPIVTGPEGATLIEKVKDSQEYMFNYHYYLDATHPYQSEWFTWPTMTKPIWYYDGKLDGNLRAGISAFGNPFVWWIPAFFVCLYKALKDKDMKAWFLCIAYLAEYLPWVFVHRAVFIYHYFTCVPFVALMIAYVFSLLKSKVSKRSYIAIASVYALTVFAAFMLFYPVLSAHPIDLDFAKDFLRWERDWVLVN